MKKTQSTMLPWDFRNALINTFSIVVYSNTQKLKYTGQKFTVSKILLMFFNFFMFKNTIKSEILWNIITC